MTERKGREWKEEKEEREKAWEGQKEKGESEKYGGLCTVPGGFPCSGGL